jgi:hypothetical protein
MNLNTKISVKIRVFSCKFKLWNYAKRYIEFSTIVPYNQFYKETEVNECWYRGKK